VNNRSDLRAEENFSPSLLFSPAIF